jgi:hypothetical protein
MVEGVAELLSAFGSAPLGLGGSPRAEQNAWG